jgi:thiamine biosynthesis lipoprotein
VIVKQEDRNLYNVMELRAMNTDFFVSISDSRNPDWKDYLLNWFSYVEKEWSRFSTNNELDRINRMKIGQKMILTPPLFDVLKKAEDYRKKTNGYFSPYLKDWMVAHGYGRSFTFKTAEQFAAANPSVIDSCPFAFNEREFSVTRIEDGNVDLGGIAKGYAVESAANWLKQYTRAKYGIVDGGGDMTVWSEGEKEWKIGIADPFDPEKEIRQITITNGSIATSNIVYRRWHQGNLRKHHILNGKTGQPVVTDVIQATIITENCVDAEVAAKLCFMEKKTELTQLFMQINRKLKAVLIFRNGNVKII